MNLVKKTLNSDDRQDITKYGIWLDQINYFDKNPGLKRLWWFLIILTVSLQLYFVLDIVTDLLKEVMFM